MNRSSLFVLLVGAALFSACGEAAPSSAGAATRGSGVRQLLTGTPESIEFEAPASRQELYRELVRISQAEAGGVTQPLLFPVLKDGAFVAAPGLDGRGDLLTVTDAGASLQLRFPNEAGRSWAEDRRDSLQGLSEREAAELVSRSLLNLWSVKPVPQVEVDRADGAPYAAAYVDGILRLNPSFLYLAVSASSAQ